MIWMALGVIDLPIWHWCSLLEVEFVLSFYVDISIIWLGSQQFEQTVEQEQWEHHRKTFSLSSRLQSSHRAYSSRSLWLLQPMAKLSYIQAPSNMEWKLLGHVVSRSLTFHLWESVAWISASIYLVGEGRATCG